VTGQQAPIRGVSRIVRGVLLAGASGALAVAAHTVAGGMLPDPGLTALLTVGVAGVGIAMADRRRGQGAILLALGAAQLATHVLLSVASQGMPDVVDPLVMTGAHAAAVLVTAALLARADAVVLGLAGLLAMLLPRLMVAPPPPAGPLVSWRVAAPVDRAMAVLLRLSSPRRGPPVPA
jgi:hypothetical protein